MTRLHCVVFVVASLLASGAVASDWKISAGATMISTPEYPGAADRRFLVVPSWDVEYRERFFSKGLDFAGVYLTNSRFRSGAALAWDFARNEESGVDGTMHAKVFGEWKQSLASLKAEAAHDVLGNGHGLQGTLDASVAVPFFSPWFFAAGPGVTWIDEENARSFFGSQAGAGVRDIHLNFVVRRRLPGEWSATAVTVLSRLQGDAARSAFTERDDELSLIVTLSRRIR